MFQLDENCASMQHYPGFWGCREPEATLPALTVLLTCVRAGPLRNRLAQRQTQPFSQEPFQAEQNIGQSKWRGRSRTKRVSY